MLIAGEKLRQQAYERTVDEILHPRRYMEADRKYDNNSVFMTMSYVRRTAEKRLKILERLR